MRIVTIAKDCAYDGVALKANARYMVAESEEGNLRGIGAVSKSVPLDPFFREYKGEDLNGKKLLTWRTGGAGDIFMLQPAINAVKEKYRDVSITVVTMKPEPLIGNPGIASVVKMPMPFELLAEHDYHAMYQGLLEGDNPEARTECAVDIFLRRLHVDPASVSVKYPTLMLAPGESDWIKKEAYNLGLSETDRVVGIHAQTSAPLRNYPLDRLRDVAASLVASGYKILVFGSPADEEAVKIIRSAGGAYDVLPATKYTLRQALVLVRRCSLMIAPDSVFVQASAANRVPVVGLYGPFHSSLRMKYFQNAIGLDPKTACTPCCTHDFRPCVKGFPSPCFSLITVESILQAADMLLYPATETHLKCLEVPGA